MSRTASGTSQPAVVPVPRSPRDISAGWATAVLAGRHPGAVVSDVEIIELDKGTTTRIPVRLEYASGTGPSRIFVKVQGSLGHRMVMGLINVLFYEARLFATVDPVPLGAPLVYATGIDRRRLQSLIVLEDLGLRGATMNKATVPLSPDVAGGVIDQLAEFHARYWDFDPSRSPTLSWVPTFRAFPGWAIVSTLGNLAAHRKHSDWLDAICPPEVRPWTSLARLWIRGITDLTRGPQTLLHGDAHIGNTYRLPDGSFGFLDWQLVSRGSWTHDVGYFLVSALDVENRRQHERDLIHRYLDGLAAHGADAPARNEAWAAYRRSPAYGLSAWTTTFGFGDYQESDLARTTAERFAAAFADLETEQALKAAGI